MVRPHSPKWVLRGMYPSIIVSLNTLCDGAIAGVTC